MLRRWREVRHVSLFAVSLCAIVWLIPVADVMDGAKPALPGPAVYIGVGDGGGHAAGVYLSSDLVVTAAHVIGDGKAALTVETETGTSVRAEVLSISREYDLALVLVPGLKAREARLNCAVMTPVGTPVTAIGHHGRFRFIHTRGTIAGTLLPPSALNADDAKRLIPINMTILPGMSGGPLVSDDGRVVGIVNAVLVDGPVVPTFTGIGFAVPASAVCEMLKQTPNSASATRKSDRASVL